jgi:hypothetical protein
MNVYSFKDAVTSKRQSLANDIDDDGDDDDVVDVLKSKVFGEEEDTLKDNMYDGEVFEPFNLRSDREIGHFDANMNFTFHKKKNEPDAWLADMDEDEATMEKSIGEAALAKQKKEDRDRIEQQKATRERLSPMQLKMQILQILQKGETVAQGMRRLSSKKLNNKKSKDTSISIDPETTKQNKILLEKLTEIADDLLSYGISGILDMSYDAIEVSTARWEYKALDGTIQGPYTSEQISEWKKAGYFTGSSAVMMRKVGISGVEWNSTTSSSGSDRICGIKSQRPFETTHPSSKKIKSDHEELLDDFDDDDNDNNNIKDNDNKDQSQVNDNTQENFNPWISSDDVDFGDYVKLNYIDSDDNNNDASDDDDNDRKKLVDNDDSD